MLSSILLAILLWRSAPADCHVAPGPSVRIINHGQEAPAVYTWCRVGDVIYGNPEHAGVVEPDSFTVKPVE